MTDDMPEAYRKLQTDFNAALEQLEKAMEGVQAGTQGINTGAQEISTASDDLSRRSEQQASALEQTAAALHEIAATGRKTAEGAAQARGVVSHAKTDAEKSGEVVRKAIEAMGAIEKSSQQISQIIGVIDEIAFQTNLLALNASVEAARAGDAGRGFTVVASEVRVLAQRTAEAAKEIKDLISASTMQVGQGVHLVAETGKALERIVEQVSEITTAVAEIAASAEAQATGVQEVNNAINQMDEVTQRNAAMAEEATAASRSLAEESDHLTSLIDQFKIGNAATVETLPQAADGAMAA
jgi:methyl-accepting chemotaxis protein